MTESLWVSNKKNDVLERERELVSVFMTEHAIKEGVIEARAETLFSLC